MSRHGEVKKQLDNGRIPDGHDKAVRLLLDQAGYQDARIPDKWAPTVGTLARKLHVSERTVQRILADLGEHGWLVRCDTGRRGRVVGALSPGRDFGFSTGGVCPVDGRPLPSPRSRFCSDRCRKAAQRQRDRERDSPQVSEPGVTLHVANQPGDMKCDVTSPVGRVRQRNVTTRRSDDSPAKRAAKGKVVGRMVENDLGVCIGAGCGKPARRACRTCWDHAGLEVAGG